MAVIFASFQTQYPNQFDWDYGRDPRKLEAAKRAWFRNAIGMLPDTLFNMALRRMGEACKKIPSLHEFLELCRPRPEALGMPSVEGAYQEAVSHSTNARHRWSHAAVRIASNSAGAHDMRAAEGWRAEQVRKAFEHYYGELVLQVARGEELTPPHLALSHDGNRPAVQVQEEFGEEFLRKVMHAQGLDSPGAGSREALLKRLRINRGANHG